MTGLDQAWTERTLRWRAKLPPRIRSAVEWVQEPARYWTRQVAGILLILGGVFSILPVLGLWMLPLGLALLAQDVPALRAPLERTARWGETAWSRLRARIRGKSRT